VARRHKLLETLGNVVERFPEVHLSGWELELVGVETSAPLAFRKGVRLAALPRGFWILKIVGADGRSVARCKLLKVSLQRFSEVDQILIPELCPVKKQRSMCVDDGVMTVFFCYDHFVKWLFYDRAFLIRIKSISVNKCHDLGSSLLSRASKTTLKSGAQKWFRGDFTSSPHTIPLTL